MDSVQTLKKKKITAIVISIHLSASRNPPLPTGNPQPLQHRLGVEPHTPLKGRRLHEDVESRRHTRKNREVQHSGPNVCDSEAEHMSGRRKWFCMHRICRGVQKTCHTSVTRSTWSWVCRSLARRRVAPHTSVWPEATVRCRCASHSSANRDRPHGGGLPHFSPGISTALLIHTDFFRKKKHNCTNPDVAPAAALHLCSTCTSPHSNP